MKNRFAQNKETHGAGDKVLKAVRLPDTEIDAIVSGPELFERVRAGLGSTEGPALAGDATETRSYLYTFFTQRAFAPIAAAVLVFGAIALFSDALQQTSESGIVKNAPAVGVTKPAPGVTETPAVEVVSASMRETGKDRRHKPNAAAKLVNVKKPAMREKDTQMGEFQTLTYVDDLNGAGEGARIVRVSLSPASLYAMGVDVAIENNTGRIKADLLIGADGVMKGVRVEKRN